MTPNTNAQIEARAFALHQTRNANAKRHGWSQQAYEAEERAFCIRAAADALAEEAYQAELKTAEDRWYADQLAQMTDEQMERRVAQIDQDVSELPFRSLRTNIALVEAVLKDERRRLVTEQFRRSVADTLRPASGEAMEAAE